MTRNEFIKGAGAAAVVAAAAADSVASDGERAAAAHDYKKLQAEIDVVTPQDYARYCEEGSGRPSETSGHGAAALVRLDEAFDRVLAEVKSTTVTGRPAIWYVYNMGVVVKTAGCCFSIDLRHRKGAQMEPLLDFALITHNHGDHFTEDFYRAMNGAKKTVISNFKDNYGVRDRMKNGGYTRAEKTFRIGDVSIRTSLTDHNGYLVDFTTAFEVTAGDYTIYHSGDCSNPLKLNPTRRPDIWFVHPYCGLKAADGVRRFHPKTTAIVHLTELGHANGWARWTYEDGFRAAGEVKKAGGDAIVPVWGDRLV